MLLPSCLCLTLYLCCGVVKSLLDRRRNESETFLEVFHYVSGQDLQALYTQPCSSPVILVAMSDNGSGELVSGNDLPGGFPQWVKERAVTLCEITQSATRAQRQLAQELEGSGIPAPSYPAVWAWARDYENVVTALRGDRKSELVAMASDVMEVYAAEAIGAAPDLTPYQKVIGYGISADKRAAWESGNRGNQFNVQFNFVKREP